MNSWWRIEVHVVTPPNRYLLLTFPIIAPTMISSCLLLLGHRLDLVNEGQHNSQGYTGEWRRGEEDYTWCGEVGCLHLEVIHNNPNIQVSPFQPQLHPSAPSDSCSASNSGWICAIPLDCTWIGAEIKKWEVSEFLVTYRGTCCYTPKPVPTFDISDYCSHNDF